MEPCRDVSQSGKSSRAPSRNSQISEIPIFLHFVSCREGLSCGCWVQLRRGSFEGWLLPFVLGRTPVSDLSAPKTKAATRAVVILRAGVAVEKRRGKSAAFVCFHDVLHFVGLPCFAPACCRSSGEQGCFWCEMAGASARTRALSQSSLGRWGQNLGGGHAPRQASYGITRKFRTGRGEVSQPTRQPPANC